VTSRKRTYYLHALMFIQVGLRLNGLYLYKLSASEFLISCLYVQCPSALAISICRDIEVLEKMVLSVTFYTSRGVLSFIKLAGIAQSV
jgi:hypothetical protein